MMDHFKEDIVSPRAKVLSNVLYVLCWVFIVLFGGYALMMLQVVMLQFSVMALVTVVSAVFFFANRWAMNAIESGEGLAHSLGISVNGVRLANMLVASAAASTVIAFCGIVNFVGLVAPHVMRRLLGADYRFLLPASALAGAGMLLVSDILCHVVVAPLILPISAITSFVGAPIFIYLLFRGVSR